MGSRSRSENHLVQHSVGNSESTRSSSTNHLLEERRGGGSGTQKFVYQKWPKSDFPDGEFHFVPRWSLWSRVGGGGLRVGGSTPLLLRWTAQSDFPNAHLMSESRQRCVHVSAPARQNHLLHDTPVGRKPTRPVPHQYVQADVLQRSVQKQEPAFAGGRGKPAQQAEGRRRGVGCAVAAREVLQWPSTAGGGGWYPPTESPPPPTRDQRDHRGTKRNSPSGKSDLGHFWYTNFWVPDPPPSSLLIRGGRWGVGQSQSQRMPPLF